MAYSRQRAMSDGTLQRLDVALSYIRRADINVLLDGVHTENWAWAGNSDAIQFPSPIPNGVEVTLVRTTQSNKVIHEFAKGAKFVNTSVDQDFLQMLYLAQEYTEGGGPEIDLYNKAPRRCHVGFRWDGTNVVLGAKSGVASVSRIGRGDYLVTWDTAFASKDAYVPVVSQSTDASSNPGSYTIVSYTPTNMRVQMYIGTATADPLMVWVRAEQ